MTVAPDWWKKPRRISVVVDNPSWILPFAEQLVSKLRDDGDQAALRRSHADIGEGIAAFYLGCIHITPPHVFARNRRNLVVHASDLPRGRGFSPLTWLTLDGETDIPICLLEMNAEADAGPVIYRDRLRYEGHELIEEMREALAHKSIELCRRFLAEPIPPEGVPQSGAPSIYPRRRPEDSALDPHRSLAEQFKLLRVVDNDRYPAFFDFRGHRYILTVRKAPGGRDGS